MSTSFPMRTMRVRFAGATHVGRKRQHNEDRLLLPDQEKLAIVADGMGGHASGEIAAQFAVDTIAEFFAQTVDAPISNWPYKIDQSRRYDTNRLITGIKLANLKVFNESSRNPAWQGMGTTIVASLFLNDQVIFAHVGDSRGYRLRQNQLFQLTEDHSLLNDYLKSNRIKEEDASQFQQKNVVVRALGMKEAVQVDTYMDTPCLNDIYLLCTDGLSGMVPDDQITQIMQAHRDLDEMCEKLIEQANENGGIDNITVIIARMEAL